MLSRKILIVIAALFLIQAVACGKAKEKEITFGSFKDGVYSNAYFNFKISIPDTWYVMTDEERIELMKKGSELVAGDNENLKAAFNASDLSSLSLLMSFESAPGSPVTSNPSVMVVAEKVKHLPGIKRGSDYHYNTKTMLGNSAMKVSFSDSFDEVVMAGSSFDVMSMTLDMGAFKQYQKQYAAIYKDYAFVIVTTHQDQAGQDKVNQILETIEIDLD